MNFIKSISLFEKYLNYLLIFILPTQLALHFWPKYSFIYGIRVDYLSPAIYLTDTLFFLIFAIWLVRNFKTLLKDVAKHKTTVLLFLSFVLLNILSSISWEIALIKWIRIIEFIMLSYYVIKRKDIFKNITISKILFYSLLFCSLIGIIQTVSGKSLGGPFYWFGERNFSIFTPGISLANIFGITYLRPYSTFSHPNSFAGFLGVVLIYLTFNRPNINKYIFWAGFILMSLTFILTFSLGAHLSMAASLFVFLIYKRKTINTNLISFVLIGVFLLSLIILIFSKGIGDSGFANYSSISERLNLNVIAGKIISANWFSGIGLNNFFLKEIDYMSITSSVWLIQPIHNIYLIVLTETGLPGFILLFIFLLSVSRKLINQSHKYYILIFLYIIFTGVFDHYWFTIYQNLILIFFFSGLFMKEKYKSF